MAGEREKANDSAEARKQERRVELHMMEKTELHARLCELTETERGSKTVSRDTLAEAVVRIEHESGI